MRELSARDERVQAERPHQRRGLCRPQLERRPCLPAGGLRPAHRPRLRRHSVCRYAQGRSRFDPRPCRQGLCREHEPGCAPRQGYFAGTARASDRRVHLPLCPRGSAFQPPPRAGRGSRRRSQKAQEEQKRPVQSFRHQARGLCGAPEPRHRDVRRYPAAGGAGRYQGLPQGAVFRLGCAVCAGDPAGSAQPLHRPRR